MGEGGESKTQIGARQSWATTEGTPVGLCLQAAKVGACHALACLGASSGLEVTPQLQAQV